MILLKIFRTKPCAPQFSIAELMTAIVAVAIATNWPCLLLPVCAAILGLALYRIGFTLFAVFVLMVVLSFALGDLAGRMAVQPHRPHANSSLNR